MSEPTLYSALKDIADAIRAKGVTGTMSAIEMPQKIASIQTGGGYESLPLTFTAVSAPATVSMTAVGSAPSVSLEYSTDNGETWTDFIVSSTGVGGTTVTLNGIGDSVFLRAKTPNARMATAAGNRNTFSMTGEVVASGNLASILNKNLQQGKVLDSTLTYHLCGLFQDCTSLVGSAKGLLIPFETLYIDSLNSLFFNTRITIAPDLPCMSSEGSTYCYTFQDCTELVQAPALPITTLGTYAYAHMFEGCTSLTTAPELPSTTLAGSCYDNMFSGCTSLVNAPELPALEVPDQAYKRMFYGCTSLVDTPQIRATSTSGSNSMNEMFNGCSSLTTVSTLLPTTVSNAAYAYMFKDCTSLTSMPVIMLEQAGTTSCCQGMFQGCTSLASVKLDYVQTAFGSSAMSNMFNGCTSLVEASLPALRDCGSGSGGGTSGSLYRMFYGCTSLKKLNMQALDHINNPYTLRDICRGDTALEEVYFTRANRWLNYYTLNDAFNGCTSLRLVDFSEATGVPGLSNVNAFNNTNSTFQIVVPDALYDQWIVATNWSSFANQIVKASEYVPAA